MKFAHGVVFAGAIALALVGFDRHSLAGNIVPYTVDANTMHLWHLDESTTPAADQANYTYTGFYTPTKNANQPMNALFGTPTVATLGNAGFTGFGTALNTAPNSTTGVYPANSVQPGLGALTPANSTADNVDHTFDNPVTHAFTMEAIVKIGFDPTVAWAAPQEIVSGEGDASDSSDRSWQFRIEANATPGTTAWRLRFQKVSGYSASPGAIGGGSSANFNLDGNIPNSGIDAIQQGQWYHVAVTFNGDFANPGNMNLYWTKVDEANFGSGAHVLATGQMNGWLREQDTDLGFGNEMRDFNGNTEPFDGSIDEVRISDIPRTADQFLFGVPEPSTLVLASMGMVGLIGCIRRRK